MLLSIIVLLVLLVIIYFHYVQGLFSATLSAIFALVASVTAFSYHESVVESLLAGKAANYAHAMVLLAMFAAIYLFLRLVADKVIPGQMRLPPTIDKVGGAFMGLIAGTFALGTFVIAAQELPFGPSVGGYSRYAISGERQVALQGNGGMAGKDAVIDEELKSDESGKFDDADKSTLWVPVDDVVLGTVRYLSNGGSLEGRQPLAAIHPDYLQELFGQRVGVETAAKRVVANVPNRQTSAVKLDGVFAIGAVQQGDNEIKSFRPSFTTKYTGQLKPAADQILLVVRMTFSRDASDDDSLVRVSPGSIHLVATAIVDGETRNVDYYPIGTLDDASMLYRNKPDDSLFISVKSGDAGADFVFLLPQNGLLQGGKGDKIADGVFVDFKRMARLDLSGMTIKTDFKASPTVHVIRKGAAAQQSGPGPGMMTPGTPSPTPSPTPTPPGPQPTPTPPTTPQPTTPQLTPPPGATSTPPNLTSPQAIFDSGANATLAVQDVKPSIELPIPIAAGPESPNPRITLPAGGEVVVKNGKFFSMTIEAPASPEKLAAGQRPIRELLAPNGNGLVQVSGTVGDGGWAWAEKADQFELVDTNGNHYKPNGGFAMVRGSTGVLFIAHYSTDYPLAAIGAQQGKVERVWLTFAVPYNTELKTLMLGAQVIRQVPGVKVLPG